MPDLSRIGEREKLKPKAGDEPHWQRLRQGAYLGYRPSKKKAGGTWFARFYDPEANRNARKRLGDYGTLSGHDVFKQAKADAEAWAETVETGGERARDMETVKDACVAYLEQRPGSIAEGVFRRHVYSDPIAKVKLDKLRRHHLKDWRKRLEQAPALVTRTKEAGKQQVKDRSKSTVNRDMVPLRAALGMVLKPGAPNTDAAWQEALRPFKGADKRRELYLDRDERKKLIEATGDEARPFVKALCLLPLRPGALASLTVRDFDKRTRALTVGEDKNGKPVPTLDQVHRVLATMPAGTDIELRNRALMALALLTGARGAALATLKLKHIDLEQGCIHQDARDVKTKASKTFTTWFCPVGGDALQIVKEWCEHLRTRLHWGEDDPLFPKTRMGLGETGGFQAIGLAREHWSGTGPVRAIYRDAFASAGLPYFNPHCFRDALVQLGERICTTPEQFKAWSQNIGHERVLTTLTSYGKVPAARQAELIRGLGQVQGESDPARLGAMFAEFVRQHGAAL